MAQKALSKKRAGKRAAAPAVDEKVLFEMYRNIYATRQFELKCSELYRAGFIRGYLHPYLGEEAIAAGSWKRPMMIWTVRLCESAGRIPPYRIIWNWKRSVFLL